MIVIKTNFDFIVTECLMILKMSVGEDRGDPQEVEIKKKLYQGLLEDLVEEEVLQEEEEVNFSLMLDEMIITTADINIVPDREIDLNIILVIAIEV